MYSQIISILEQTQTSQEKIAYITQRLKQRLMVEDCSLNEIAEIIRNLVHYFNITIE